MQSARDLSSLTQNDLMPMVAQRVGWIHSKQYNLYLDINKMGFTVENWVSVFKITPALPVLAWKFLFSSLAIVRFFHFSYLLSRQCLSS